jgi:hypothetical protein
MSQLPSLIAAAHLNPSDHSALSALATDLHRAGYIKPDMGWLALATKIIFVLGQLSPDHEEMGLRDVRIASDLTRSTRDGAGAQVACFASLTVAALRIMPQLVLYLELYAEGDGSQTLIVCVSSATTSPGEPWQWESRKGRLVPFETPQRLQEIHPFADQLRLPTIILDAVATYMERCGEALGGTAAKQQQEPIKP